MLTLNQQFGAYFYDSHTPDVYEADTGQLYYFKAFIGQHFIEVERGDCIYYFDEALSTAIVRKGPCSVSSKHLATVIRGYMHPDATRSLDGITTLPYVNGCSTKQLFPPIRLGDPTLQYLKIPAYSKEQTHHIHSTFRVVLIKEGEGKSIVGLSEQHESTDLYPGKVCILEPMCPHHFETPGNEGLVALPLHVYSSVGASEKNHPMFNGTINI